MKGFIERADEGVFRMCQLYSNMEKRRRDYGSGVNLSMREIHVIEAIGTHPDCNASSLIEMTGILKGTFSKTISHLEELELVECYHKHSNQRIMYFRLTELGRKSYLGHYAYHEQQSETMYRKFRSYIDSEQEVIIRVPYGLRRLSEGLPIMEDGLDESGLLHSSQRQYCNHGKRPGAVWL